MSSQVPRVPPADVQAAYPTAQLTWIARGGQSDVWRAQFPSSDEALRIIVSGDAARLSQEVAALQAISSSFLMRFYALETLQSQGNTLPVVRGEFIAGGTVADKLLSSTLPSETEALDCVAGLLEAIVALHNGDLIHRDVKPQNIALRGGDWTNPVLLDLGYVRAVTATSLTVYPGHIGTLNYMAPEQLRREPAKFRSDIFAVGLVLFELLTGEWAFLKVGETILISDLTDRMADGNWPDAALLGRIAPDVRMLVTAMLSYEPHARPSANKCLKEVRALRAQRP